MLQLFSVFKQRVDLLRLDVMSHGQNTLHSARPSVKGVVQAGVLYARGGGAEFRLFAGV
jgi:hypothetical protein